MAVLASTWWGAAGGWVELPRVRPSQRRSRGGLASLSVSQGQPKVGVVVLTERVGGVVPRTRLPTSSASASGVEAIQLGSSLDRVGHEG